MNAPFEYEFIYDALSPDNIRPYSFSKILDTINSISKLSDNPAFRTSEFRIAMIDFKRTGLYPNNKKKWSVKDALTIAKSQI